MLIRRIVLSGGRRGFGIASNFSETTFVFSRESGHRHTVRIFTPSIEVPFAGHPNVGTAFVLAKIGEIIAISDETNVVFEEKVGPVPIWISKADDEMISCELEAPLKPSLGKTIPVESVASALSLDRNDIETKLHPPIVASVGLPFIIAELRSRAALGRCRPRLDAFDVIRDKTGISHDLHVYVQSEDEVDIRARMFAPLDGVLEDPATGSANCALAGLLAEKDATISGDFSWRIAQGVEMGRPSVLNARAHKENGEVTRTWIGGTCAMVSKGTLYVD